MNKFAKLFLSLVVASCLGCDDRAIPPQKFRNGEIVQHVLTKEKGIVISARVPLNNVHWEYVVRFENRLGASKRFENVDAQEFELCVLSK